MKRPNGLTRREFVKLTSASALGAFALPYIVPSSALGADGAVAPNERIVMGCIGTGGQGGGLMQRFMSYEDVQVVAVNDVDRGRRESAKGRVEDHYADQKGAGTYKGCASYGDFRELLARDDINAVSIATPDHWHALASIAAAKAGKDIYCEKPLANSVGEGRAVCKAVEENKRILQTGSHERSNDSGRFACELVRNGRIGKLHTIRIYLPCDEGHHAEVRKMTTVPPPEPIPDGFDYDMWLGHTPMAPYTSRRCHFWWRFILAYGGGEMTDRGAHVIDIAQLAAGFDDTGPVEIDATGTHSTTGLYDAFMDFKFTNTFANGVKMIGESAGSRGMKFEGDKGWVFVHIHGCGLEADPPSLLKEKIGENEIQLGRSVGGHQRNFLDCVKSRKTPMAPPEVGHRTASVCHLTNIAMRVGRKLKWDPKKEEIIGDPEANKLLTPKMRPPWHL